MHIPSVLHHLHQRKRIHIKHEQYPHPNKYKALLDRVIFVVGVFGPIMTLPQVWEIWVGHEAAGVSLISWSAYLFCACIWLLYGLVHKEKPIIVSNVLGVILNITVVLGVILYS